MTYAPNNYKIVAGSGNQASYDTGKDFFRREALAVMMMAYLKLSAALRRSMQEMV